MSETEATGASGDSVTRRSVSGTDDRGPANVAPASTAGPRFIRWTCTGCGARCSAPAPGKRARCSDPRCV